MKKNNEEDLEKYVRNMIRGMKHEEKDSKRIPKILEEIGKVWSKFPQLRLMQLLINANVCYYYTEDRELVKDLRTYLRRCNRKGSSCYELAELDKR